MFTKNGGVLSNIVTLFDCAFPPPQKPSLGVTCTLQTSFTRSSCPAIKSVRLLNKAWICSAESERLKNHYLVDSAVEKV